MLSTWNNHQPKKGICYTFNHIMTIFFLLGHTLQTASYYQHHINLSVDLNLIHLLTHLLGSINRSNSLSFKLIFKSRFYRWISLITLISLIMSPKKARNYFCNNRWLAILNALGGRLCDMQKEAGCCSIIARWFAN